MSTVILDPFSAKRLARVIQDHQARSGQLPTYQDLAAAGFSREHVKEAIRQKLIEEFFVTLTNGTIVKGFRVCT
ncbi:MAG: hypothetical protein A2X94_10105 [Bdellovibrionales bacterium GWB1_55_8]|nr:MAG: hypothetical protein A2X94_10105 [Bdellovibrionales bacterium GWB1_55_8]